MPHRANGRAGGHRIGARLHPRKVPPFAGLTRLGRTPALGSRERLPHLALALQRRAGHRLAAYCALAALLALLTACQFTASPFARTAGNAGSAFAAAGTTIAYAHEGKLTVAYARSAFINYQSELEGVDQQLVSSQGGPGPQRTKHLNDLYGRAMRVVEHPCLAASCGWRAQVALLREASQAFLKASGQ